MSTPLLKCVILADRHHGLLEGIRQLLEGTFEAVLMVADANSLLAGAERLEPALVVLDLSLSRTDGLQLLRRLRARSPRSKVIVLSMHDEPTIVNSVMETGADGYVLTSAITTDLLPAVKSVFANQHYTSPSLTRRGPGAKNKGTAS